MPQHRARLVSEFVVAQDGRLLIEYLPGYAPELNPVEYLWGYWKHHALPNFYLDDLTELGFFGRRALQCMRRRPKLIRSCWRQAKLSLQYASLNNENTLQQVPCSNSDGSCLSSNDPSLDRRSTKERK